VDVLTGSQIKQAREEGASPLADPAVIGTVGQLAQALHELRRRLARRRSEARLTYRELASRSGLSKSAINDYFAGKVLPPTDRFDILLTVLEAGDDERCALATARDRVEERVEAAQSAGGVGFLPPRELPAVVSSFTGRRTELDLLDRWAQAAAPSSGTSLAVVCGTAGVGKTALVTHWAYRNRRRFPDGELYIDLQGYHPGRPVHPAEALARLMRRMGLEDTMVPEGLEERAAQYRTLLADRQMLVVLDNARSAEQVRHLLPGAGPFAVVTSRDTMAGLVARDGAQRISLGLLDRQDALDLLQTVLGPERVNAELDGAAALIQRCARLPLTLRIAAEQAMARPAVKLAEIAAEIKTEALDLFDAGGDDRTAPRAVFSWSYRHLPEQAAMVFRRVGLHPGHDLDAATAAALSGLGTRATRRALERLRQAHLIDEGDRGRFAPHDMLRCYAAELGAADDPATVHEAMRRLVEHYCGVAARAIDLAFPATQHKRSDLPGLEVSPQFAGEVEAIDWLNRERVTLVTLTRYAADHDLLKHATELSGCLWYYLNSRRHFTDARTVHDCAIRAARQQGDIIAEALALNHLASVEWMQGNGIAAIEQLQHALELSRAGNDSDLVSQTLNGLAVACWMCGRFTEAIPYYRQAVTEGGGFDHFGRFMFGSLSAVYERYGCTQEMITNLDQAVAIAGKSGDRIGEGFGLLHVAVVRQMQGDHERAATCYRQALARGENTGDAGLSSYARTHLAVLCQLRGGHHQAVEELSFALHLSRDIGNQINEVTALIHLGISHHVLNDTPHAMEHLHEGLAMARALDDLDLEAKALNALGVCLRDTAPEKARAHHHYALTVTHNSGNLLERARAHHGLARCHALLNDPRQHEQHQSMAAELYDRLGIDADAIPALP